MSCNAEHMPCQQYLLSESSPLLLGVLKVKGLSQEGIEGLQEAVVGARVG